MFKIFKKITALAMAAVTAGALGLSAFAGGPMPQEDELAAESKVSAAAAQTALPSGLSVGTTYSLVSEMSTDSYLFALNVWGAQDINHANVDMWDWDGSKEQRFRLISSGSYYKLEAVCSSNGRVLDAYNPNASGCDADLWTNTASENDAQQLVITEDPDSKGYVITLASYPNLALTAVDLYNNAEVRFNIYTGADDQKWKFFESNDSLQRAPHPYFQNKSMWCWAASAKLVAENNGDGIDSSIDQAPHILTNTAGLHKTFYGQGTVNGTARYFADGVQYAIVKECHGNEENLGGNEPDVKRALNFAAANKDIIPEWFWNGRTTGLTDNNIKDIKTELGNGKYVIGYVENNILPYDNRTAHFIVLEKYEDGVYTVFNPWNKKDMAVNEADILNGYNYTYLDNTSGKLFGYYSFS